MTSRDKRLTVGRKELHNSNYTNSSNSSEKNQNRSGHLEERKL
ncbi:17968_t:CDS:1, partial [Gigaspora margarita]